MLHKIPGPSQPCLIVQLFFHPHPLCWPSSDVRTEIRPIQAIPSFRQIRSAPMSKHRGRCFQAWKLTIASSLSETCQGMPLSTSADQEAVGFPEFFFSASGREQAKTVPRVSQG